MQNGELRSFVAVELPRDLRAWLADLRAELSLRYGRIRWACPESIHLTLSFLGATAAGQVAGVLAAMEEAAAGEPPIELRLRGPGEFGSERRPRVLWLGLEPGPELERFAALKERLDQRLRPRGFEPEARAFRPHLTLGRNPRRHQAAQWHTIVERSTRPPVLPVAAWTLFASRLTPEGPVYTSLGKRRLTAPP
jgi:2'-5' RNA ligase